MKLWQFEAIEDCKRFRCETTESLARIEAQLAHLLRKVSALEADQKTLAALAKKLDVAGESLRASIEAATPQA